MQQVEAVPGLLPPPGTYLGTTLGQALARVHVLLHAKKASAATTGKACASSSIHSETLRFVKTAGEILLCTVPEHSV